MKKKLTFLFLGLLCLLSLSAFVKADDPFAELLKKLEEFAKKYPTEKVHLHLDKPYYAVGDDIWLKAYVIDSRSAEPSTISNILYVELINEKDSVQQQLKLPLQSGMAWGDFKLADSLNEGNYRIRAYTQWMRNAGPDFFFDKTIRIGNSLTSKINTNATFQSVVNGKVEKLNSTIKFTDDDGKTYVNNEVNYTVQVGPKIIAKGKTKTDKNSSIALQFDHDQSASPINIYATIILPNKEMITKVIPYVATEKAVDVQFFPEGGSLVSDIPSKIAIKSTNSTGNGEDVKGVIVDEKGQEVTRFETSHLGMGSFSLNPMKGKTYTAKITFKNSSEKTINLPKVEDNGYVLNVNTLDTTNLIAKIYTSVSLVGKGDLLLLAQQNGKIYFTVKIPGSKSSALINLPKAELPSGILTITLFNSASQAVAERLAFINTNFDKVDLAVTGLEKTYTKKGNVSLSFVAKNEQQPTPGSFSVAVSNTSIVQPDEQNETNIFTDLLLKSELRGYIEKPNYYFLNDDVKTKTDLDHLLLTQGWRKIEWAKLVANQLAAPKFNPETELVISGTVKTSAGKPEPNAKVSLLSNSKELLTTNTVADAQGKFAFKALNFSDSASFVVSAANEKGTNLKVEFDVMQIPQVTKNINFAAIQHDINQQFKTYLTNSKAYFDQLSAQGFRKPIMLKQVQITEQKKAAQDFGSLSSKADRIILAKDLKNVANLVDIITKIGGLYYEDGEVYSRSNDRTISFAGRKRTDPEERLGMLVLVDGSFRGSRFDINSLPPAEVEKIEILTTPSNTSQYGSRGAYGVLSITTRKGTPIDNEISATKTNAFSTKGYSTNRQFYSPKYDVNPDSKPDLRTTVYWNPNMVANTDGKFSFNYFNTDQTGLYRVVIEGVDELGNLARKVYTYEVK